MQVDRNGTAMQYVSFKIRPGDRWFHPIDERIAADAELRHGPIHNIDLLADGSVVVLYEVYGDCDRVAELLAEQGEAETAETVPIGDDTLVYTHGQPSDDVRTLLETANRHRILIDTPITFTGDDEVEVTIVGDAAAIQETFADAPSSVQLTVEKTGEYRPGRERMFTDLTDRQQEILLTALEMGYYEDPRRTTYSEIADRLHCTATTVGEHLRKIERQVLFEIAPEDRDVDDVRREVPASRP